MEEAKTNEGTVARKGACKYNDFPVVCLVAWPSNESEAGSDLAMIGTSLLFLF